MDGVSYVQAMQKQREDKLVTTLKNKLEPFVEGRTDDFVNWATAEARRLSTAGKSNPPFSLKLLTAPPVNERAQTFRFWGSNAAHCGLHLH